MSSDKPQTTGPVILEPKASAARWNQLSRIPMASIAQAPHAGNELPSSLSSAYPWTTTS